MTELQEFMLCVCFGAVVGMIGGNIASIIIFAIHDLKEKRRRRKEAEETVSGEG